MLLTLRALASVNIGGRLIRRCLSMTHSLCVLIY